MVVRELPSAFEAVLAIKEGFGESWSAKEGRWQRRKKGTLVVSPRCAIHIVLLPLGLFEFHNYVFNSQSNMYL